MDWPSAMVILTNKPRIVAECTGRWGDLKQPISQESNKINAPNRFSLKRKQINKCVACSTNKGKKRMAKR